MRQAISLTFRSCVELFHFVGRWPCRNDGKNDFDDVSRAAQRNVAVVAEVFACSFGGHEIRFSGGGCFFNRPQFAASGKEPLSRPREVYFPVPNLPV